MGSYGSFQILTSVRKENVKPIAGRSENEQVALYIKKKKKKKKLKIGSPQACTSW